MRRVTAFLAVLGCGLVVFWGVSYADHHEEKANHTIAEVMQLAHKKVKLLPKVTGGKASEAEKKKLLELYASLWDNKPPKGSMESWRKLTGDVIVAACKVVLGEKGAEKKLKEAADCKGCHNAHKEK